MSDKQGSPIIGPEGLAINQEGLAQQVSGLEKKSDAATEALRREMLLEVRQITTMLTEWRTAHDAVHTQQQRALDAATAALTDKLADMNEFRQQSRDRESLFASREAVERSMEGLSNSIANEKTDTRRRFEMLEAKMNEMQTTLSREARTEGRPGQDLHTSQGAIIAAILFTVTVLGFVVVIANFLSSR